MSEGLARLGAILIEDPAKSAVDPIFESLGVSLSERFPFRVLRFLDPKLLISVVGTTRLDHAIE